MQNGIGIFFYLIQENDVFIEKIQPRFVKKEAIESNSKLRWPRGKWQHSSVIPHSAQLGSV